ncbi:glycosyltransferase [Paenibacillus sediminis]|uniref:Glycosyltransferase n=1 Tax=Paenibacillus sediminis TaxID=664909 RepID=A0ABS4H243_9BACL|nr:glycosyltransferase [Paenibacillus sediminis]MBP1936600.1 hypothetical protein [Paenibacillus sediminis]
MKAKRILWLLNHDTLSKFELPLIRDLGFEIFTPKIALKEILQASGSITYDYDHTLTIPEEDLNTLNQYDFCSLVDMPLNIKKIINSYFATAITYTDTSFSILRKLIHNFEGNIFFRAFGVGLSKFNNYTELIDYYFQRNDKYKLQQISDRFWFSQCYPNLAEVEEDIYKKNAIYMPLGLPLEFYDIENQWVGDMNKLLFFCSRIKYVAEAEKVYNEFKRDFRDFDYLIAGNQPVPVDDDKVTGFLEREELNELYRKCKVMYYHSTNPRHLHYHPLEAMIAGMPVVYMDGGLLSFLGGKRQAGRCKDINEARNKVQRILDGDAQLIEDIRQDQKEILYKFSYEFNKEEWENNFLPIVETINSMDINSPKKIAVFTSIEQEKCHLDDSIEMVSMLYQGIIELNAQNRLILNVYKDSHDFENDISELTEKNVTLREYTMESISAEHVSDTLALMFKNQSLWHDSYLLPVDYAQNYVDADLWLFLDHQIEKPIAPIIPFGIYVDNIGDRHYETISSARISNLKNAAFILTNSQQTKIDLIKHLGIKKEKIYRIPFAYSKRKLNSQIYQGTGYILIEADLNRTELVKKLFDDVNGYFELYRNELNIKIYFNNYVKDKNGRLFEELNELVQKSDLLKNNISLYVNLEKNEYDALYAHAQKIIIPHNMKNIFYKLAKAAYFSKQIIVNDFPFYKEFEDILNYNFHYKKFNTNKNVLLEVLSIHDEVAPSEFKYNNDKTGYFTNDVSSAWRKLL